MAKIRKLKTLDIKKFQEMIEYISPGLASNLAYEGIFRLLPFAAIHNLLPINLKFLQECYVAVEGKKLLGLISLIPDCKEKTRWRINRLVLNANAYETGKQLIDYVVNKYGGAGVETFLAIIDENHAETINLFKNACRFRSGAKIYIWEKDNITEQNLPNNPNLFKEIKCSDAKKLQELDQQSLFPQFRISLAKEEADFKFGIKNLLINQFRGYKVRRLILDNSYEKSIEGYIMIMTKDNLNFWADIVLSLAYQDYYEDIVNYIINYVNFQNKNVIDTLSKRIFLFSFFDISCIKLLKLLM